MLHLFDVNHKKIAGLVNYKDLNIEREINALPILSFLYPVNDKKFPLILEECYIRTKENEYVVKEINYSDENYNQYVCKVNVEELQGNLIDHFDVENNTCENCIKLALSSTSWTLGTCEVIKKRTVRKNNSSVYDVLQEIQSAYKCEITYDAINKKINVYEKMGSDKGTYFTEQLNLKKLDIQRNSYDYITRLFPTGKDGLGIEGVNGGIKYIENYQYSNKKISAYWSDDRYTDAGELLEDAIERLNFLSKPLISYKADVYDIARCSEKYKNILEYSLGDTVTLLSKSNKVKEKQRIVKLTEYPEEPEKNTVELANRITSLEDLNVRFIDTSDTVDDVTTSDGKIDGSKIDKIEWGKIQNAKIGIADVNELNATISNIGKLSASEGDVTILNSVNGNIKNLLSDKVTASDLKAVNGSIETLNVRAASIEKLLSGNIGAENIKTGAITAGSGIIAKEAIGSAEIHDLDVSKLNGGEISTAKFKVTGSNGRLTIQDNRLQIFDEDKNSKLFERICIGDVNHDNKTFGMRIRGADGSTVLFDENGETKEGFSSGYEKLEDKSLDPKKIDIEKTVTLINGASTQIQGSKVQLNNSSLDAAFSSINSTVTSQGKTIESQSAKISENADAISAKLDSKTFNSYKSTNDEVITTINTNLSAQTSSISALKNQISLKVSQTDIDNSINKIEIGGKNLLLNSAFRENTNCWYLQNGYSLDKSLKCGSFNSIKYEVVEDNSRDTSYALTQSISCNPGDIFTASVYAFTDDLTTIDRNSYGVILEINFIDANGNVINWDGKSFIPVSNNVWDRYTYTSIVAPNNAVNVRLAIYVARSGRIWFSKPKLEKGNKVTDWTPAPEDLQIDLDTLKTRISSAETSINENSKEIALKASQQTLDAANSNINGLSSRMRTAESEINVQAQKIASKVDENGVHSIISQSPQDVQIAFNGISSNTVSIKEDGLKVSLGNGDYLKMSSNVFDRYIENLTADELSSHPNHMFGYHYLTYSGDATVSPAGVQINLPHIFDNKYFTVVISVKSVSISMGHSFIQTIDCNAVNRKFGTNPSFDAYGYVSMGTSGQDHYTKNNIDISYTVTA